MVNYRRTEALFIGGILALFLVMVLMAGNTTGASMNNHNDPRDVKLYYHSDAADRVEWNISTIGPGSGNGGAIATASETMENFSHRQPFTHEMDVYSDNETFYTRLGLDDNDIAVWDGKMRVEIYRLSYDGTGNVSESELLAKSAWDGSGGENWFCDFENGIESPIHFDKGQNIQVSVRVETDDASYASVTVETAGNYYLLLNCTPVKDKGQTINFGIKALDYESNMSVNKENVEHFYPNMPSHLRFMNITGTIKSAFGSYDVDSVSIYIYYKDGGDKVGVLNATANRTSENENSLDSFEYYFWWAYDASDMPSTPSGEENYFHLAVSYDSPGNDTWSGMSWFDVLSKGVYLEWDIVGESGIREYQVKQARGDTKNYEVTVLNIGSESETIDLSASSLRSWDVGINGTDEFTLNAAQSTTKLVSVVVDQNATHVDTVTVLADVDDADVPVSDTVRLLVEPGLDYSFEIEALNDTTLSVKTGEEVEFWFELTNTGSQEGNYSFKTFDTVSGGWDYSFVPITQELTVAKGASMVFKLIVEAPSTAGDVTDLWINITVESEEDNDKWEIVKTHTNLITYDMLTVIGATSKESDATGTTPWSYAQVSFTVEVTNGESEDQTVSAELVAAESDIDGLWTFSVSPNNFVLASDDTQQLTINVKPHSGVMPGEFDIKVKFSFQEAVKDEFRNFEVEVEEVYDLEIDLDAKGRYKVDGGDKTTFTVMVENKGNVEDTIDISVSFTWKVLIDGVETKTHSITLDPGDDAEFDIEVFTKEIDDDENYKLTITVSSSSSDVDDVEEDVIFEVGKKTSTNITTTLQDNAPLIIMLVFILAIGLVLMGKRKRRQYPPVQQL